jgi:hypothetical protein
MTTHFYRYVIAFIRTVWHAKHVIASLYIVHILFVIITLSIVIAVVPHGSSSFKCLSNEISSTLSNALQAMYGYAETMQSMCVSTWNEACDRP